MDFGRPTWIDVDLGLLDRLKHFTNDLNVHKSKMDVDCQNNSDLDIMKVVRSVAMSTDYVAVTAISGQDIKVDPVVKISSSSLNLGVSFKTDERKGRLCYHRTDKPLVDRLDFVDR